MFSNFLLFPFLVRILLGLYHSFLINISQEITLKLSILSGLLIEMVSFLSDSFSNVQVSVFSFLNLRISVVFGVDRGMREMGRFCFDD